MNPIQTSLRKITIELPDDAWHGHATESVWAEALPSGHYRLRNVPFFACGLSVEDVVAVHEVNGAAIVSTVVVHSGHSTYRIFLGEGLEIETSKFPQFWKPLEELGCTYERATERLIGVDVPPDADIHDVYHLLEAGENAGLWDFEEGHCGHC